MFANYDTNVFDAMTDNSTGFWTNRNMLSSCSRRILHDPECKNQCCLNSLEKPLQCNQYNDLEQLLNDIERNSRESTPSSSTNENQYLYYDASTSKEFQVPAYRESIDHLGMVYSDLYNVRKGESRLMSVEAKQSQTNHGKGILKRKRKRTVFTTEQIITMESVFKKRPYVCKEERLFLTKKLNVSEKAIKIWFQNRRRVTEKREKDQSDSCHSDSTNEEIYDVHKARLDYIETQINENTDEYGFVTLNNKAISELVKVIDSVLSHKSDRDNSLHQDNKVSQSENYLMYEPISPGSLSEDSRETENMLEWKPSIPEESLQRLIDIQTVLYM